jgi:outer membrane protein TolC
MRLAVLAVGLACLTGCTRAHYRLSADREVYPILGERASAAGFATDRLELETAPQSRLADPTNPDRPPRPPDDPVAAQYMERPNGMHGAHWPHKRIDWIEPPGWEASLPWGADGKIKLDAERSFELALRHSREYQAALERLYLAALALTLNRFEFETRWALTNVTTFATNAPGTAAESTNLTSTSGLGFQRNFAAGGQLLVDFANSFLLEYTGGGKTSVSSTFVTGFVQPLLRNAGRRVRLEGLTQAERDVLYAARDFYRFRKQFWASVTTLDGGYLSLLLQVQTIRNQQTNLEGQSQNLKLHEELFRGGKKSIVQVDQAFQGYQAARATIVQGETILQNSLDQFKILLGLPPRIPIELDDAVLNPFVLADPKLEMLRDEVDVYQRARNRDVDAPPTLADLRKQYADYEVLAGRVPPFVEIIERELDEWGKKLDPTKTDDSAQRARAAYTLFVETLPSTKKDLARLRETAAGDAAGLAEAKRKEGWEALVGNTRKLLTLVDNLIAVQSQVRINRIELPPVTWAEPDALAFAHENRLDLQTEQAQVTDACRKVLVAANALRAELTIVANANLGTGKIGGSNIIDFSNDAARYDVGVRFDGPLNRLAERNAYRTALIAYQQARRDYMLQSDRIELSVRRDLRLLELARVNFEIGRLTVVSNARQLEALRQRILVENDPKGTSTIDILNALNSLLAARNALASGYINYEQLRVQLLLDLEALRLDSRGYPIDERRPDTADFAGDRYVPPAAANPGVPADGTRGQPPARLRLP